MKISLNGIWNQKCTYKLQNFPLNIVRSLVTADMKMFCLLFLWVELIVEQKVISRCVTLMEAKYITNKFNSLKLDILNSTASFNSVQVRIVVMTYSYNNDKFKTVLYKFRTFSLFDLISILIGHGQLKRINMCFIASLQKSHIHWVG